MTVRLLHLYGDIMNLYGEYANLAVLERYLKELGHEVACDTLSMYEDKDISGYDLYYLGAGTERKMKTMLPELLRYRDVLQREKEAGRILLFTGNACDLLGNKITDSDGNVFEGLGFGEFETTEGNRRITGDCICKMEGMEEELIGFINKCSVSKGISSPLLRLSMGFGNEKDKGPDGYRDGNCMGTHVTGPILVKNPAMLRYIASLLLGKDVATPGWEHMTRSYEVTHRALLARLAE